MHSDLAALSLPGTLIHPRHDVAVVDLRAIGGGDRQRRPVGSPGRLSVLDPTCVLSLLLAAPHGLRIGRDAAAGANVTAVDETFVKTGSRPEGHIFVRNELGKWTAEARRKVETAIARASDDAALEADTNAWAEGLAAEYQFDAPAVDIEGAALRPNGRVNIDCTNAPGIQYSPATEYGNVIRGGYAFELRVPVSGDTDLLDTGIPGVEQLPARVRGNEIICEWHWPDVKGTSAFERDVTTFKNQLSRGIEALATEVERINTALVAFAIEQIEARRSAILAEREFLGGLTIPLVRDDEEPQPFNAPPPIARLETPAAKIRAPAEKPPERELQPQLDEFYDHILEVIRAVGRGLERSPGSFSGAEEEVLRDHMLVTLNTHYRGATYAEAFNGEGKTDILIRVYDRNAFIGECKWWAGPKSAEEALTQLFGYTTWQDSRVALIFYVRTKDLAPTIEKAKEVFSASEQFVEWLDAEGEGELKCRVRWPDDPGRAATLTAVFVHLPKSS